MAFPKLLTGCCIIWTTVCSVGASAQETPADKLLQCGSQKSPQARLVCFDQLTNEERLRRAGEADLSLEQNAEPAAAPRLTPQERKQAFGADRIEKRIESDAVASDPDSETFTIVRFRRDGQQRYVFHMSSGQIWRELEPGRRVFKKSDVLAATITRALSAPTI